MSFKENLIRVMAEKKISQRQLAIRSGVDRSQINKLINGKFDKSGGSSIRTLQKLAEALDVNPEELMGTEIPDKSGLPDKSVADMLKAFTSDFADKLQKLEIVEIPIRGIIPAGNPAVEEEIDLGVVRVPREVVEGKIDRVFALKIGGESLSGDGLHYGDNVLIDPDAPIIDGKIYAVRIGGTEVLARHVYKENGHLRLESSNNEYKRVLATDVEIQGRLIYQMRKL